VQGPQGATGAQGAKGDIGATGPAGPSTLAGLQGSPCTVNGHPSTLKVSTDNTTGAVSMTCRPVDEVSVTVSGGTMTAIFLLDDTTNAFHECDGATSCSTLVAAGDKIRVSIRSGDLNAGGGTSFTYTCPGEAMQTSDQVPVPGGSDYQARCPLPPSFDTSINADYAVSATFTG
jgi:hypothetical protein